MSVHSKFHPAATSFHGKLFAAIEAAPYALFVSKVLGTSYNASLLLCSFFLGEVYGSSADVITALANRNIRLSSIELDFLLLMEANLSEKKTACRVAPSKIPHWMMLLVPKNHLDFYEVNPKAANSRGVYCTFACDSDFSVDKALDQDYTLIFVPVFHRNPKLKNGDVVGIKEKKRLTADQNLFKQNLMSAVVTL